MTKKFLIFTLLSAVGLLGCQDNYNTDRLIIWSTESDENAQVKLEEIALELESSHSGLDVIIETMSWGTTSEKLLNARQASDLPDISHIQPFMAYSLYSSGDLLPVTDVVNDIEAENGPIFPAVRDLQKYGNPAETYGIAYAVGSTFWSVRTDLIPNKDQLYQIKTWKDYLEFATAANASNPDAMKVTIPGGSSFFIDQLYGELVANAGGSLFDVDQCPILNSPASKDALVFMKDLKDNNLLAIDWATTSYPDQFNQLASGKVFSVPVTYARASRAVEKVYENSSNKTIADANDKELYWLDQPTLEANTQSLGTIDAEPWVIFNVSKNRKNQSGMSNDTLAKEFLRLFYSKKHYTDFTKTVPVHLTPIFESIASSSEYKSSIGEFKSWNDNTIRRLKDGTTRPILMPGGTGISKNLPFLLEFSRAKVLSGAVSDVLQSDFSIEDATNRAQERALRIVARSGIDCK